MKVIFFCRNCEYSVMKFVYILGMYFAKLRLFSTVSHIIKTLSHLCVRCCMLVAYAGC